MKFRFIGKQPMTTHGIGVTRPGDIIDVRNPKIREEVENSPLFIQADEKRAKKEIEKPKQEEEKDKKEDK
jgi:hypothetical protein